MAGLPIPLFHQCLLPGRYLSDLSVPNILEGVAHPLRVGILTGHDCIEDCLIGMPLHTAPAARRQVLKGSNQLVENCILVLLKSRIAFAFHQSTAKKVVPQDTVDYLGAFHAFCITAGQNLRNGEGDRRALLVLLTSGKTRPRRGHDAFIKGILLYLAFVRLPLQTGNFGCQLQYGRFVLGQGFLRHLRLEFDALVRT